MDPTLTLKTGKGARSGPRPASLNSGMLQAYEGRRMAEKHLHDRIRERLLEFDNAVLVLDKSWSHRRKQQFAVSG